MNHNVYLPDDISEGARAAELNLSRLLRSAVIEELDHLAAIKRARDGMVPQRVKAEDSDGPVWLRFTGKPVGGDALAGIVIYLTDAGAVIVVEEEGYSRLDSAEDFGHWVEDPHRNNLGRPAEQVLREALLELGQPRVIEID